jgi:hypothetical protein
MAARKFGSGPILRLTGVSCGVPVSTRIRRTSVGASAARRLAFSVPWSESTAPATIGVAEEVPLKL